VKRLKSIGLVLTALSILTLLHFNFGIFNRFNFITAYWDRWNGKERIIIYGEMLQTDSIKTALAPKFGFKYERQEDCTVTKPFINGVKDYNSIMGQQITERLGDDWDKILEQEILKVK
jgi:hypothetical protein